MALMRCPCQITRSGAPTSTTASATATTNPGAPGPESHGQRAARAIAPTTSAAPATHVEKRWIVRAIAPIRASNSFLSASIDTRRPQPEIHRRGVER